MSDSPGTSDQVGPYKLIELLGEGGMGEVWLAEQSEPVHRRVALKVIKLGMDTKQVLARLEAERQALAVMDHPNIARFYDGGATKSGRPYFVMELVRGTSITDYCDANRLPTSERIGLFVDVCQAVQHAHHKGVIHRDLKPSNVLVTVKDNKPVVKIIDFGIAKALGQDLTDQTLFTRMGQIIGTPEYMSPEQAEMSGVDVDTRADVYSLGATLYELLVGARPLDLRGRADQAIGIAIRETEIPRPSTRLTSLGETQDTVAEHRHTTVDALRRELRSDLDWIILKAMEKDRTRRYETANGFAQDLERHLRHEPVLAHALSTSYRFGKFLKRHRAQVSFAAVILLLLVVSAVGMSVQAARIARERDRAEGEAEKAKAVNDFMVGTLLSPDPVDGLGADATIIEALDAAVSGMEDEFSSEPEVDAAIRSSIGWAYFKLDRHEDAGPLLQEAFRLRSESPGTENPDLAESLHRLAALLEVTTGADTAEALFRRALDMRIQSLPADDYRIAETQVRISGILINRGDYEEAREILREALLILENGNAEPVQITAATTRLGQIDWILGDLTAAEAHFRKALSERREYLDAHHPLVGEGLNNLAVVLDDLGKDNEAVAMYREALVVTEQEFGESSGQVSPILGNIALILSDQGEIAEADSLFRRALSIDETHYGPLDPNVAFDKINLGRHLCRTDRGPEGLEVAADALRILRSAFEPDQWEIGIAGSTLGLCLGKVGRFAEGETALLEALALVEPALGSGHLHVTRIRSRLADLYEAWGKPEKAREYRAGGSVPR